MAVKQWSPSAKAAALACRNVVVSPTPAKLKGKNAAAIKRAVRMYYLG